ncbi:MAG: hypothetical protein PGN26_04090 [Xylophilus ampelinus]
MGAVIRLAEPSSGMRTLSGSLTASGLPAGLEFDGPVGSDERLLAIGMAVEALLGRLPTPPN